MSRKAFLDSWGQPTLWAVDWATLRFVVRRHRATHLHWDLRIEANGILYSWWMHQPPSTNPLRVVGISLSGPHDPKHMLSERVIPEGQPGAGPTLVEEFGWVMPMPASNLSQARSFHEQYLDGRIELWIEGSRLRGGFVLEGRGERWRIRKLADEFASTIEPEWTGKSALTGRTLDELPRSIGSK